MNSTESKKRTRRTNEVIAEHQAFAKQLLDMNVPPYAVALQLQTKFGLSRPTAWRDVQHANAERGSSEEGGIHAPQEMMSTRDTLIQVLYQAVLTSSVEGDFKTLPRLTKEIRELMKIGGPGAGRHPQDGPDEEMDLLAQIQYIYNKRRDAEEASKV
jgi:hypothetical protein